MKMLLLLLVTAASAAPAKLDLLSLGNSLARSNYDGPVVPSGLYELPGPPPPPIIPTRPPTTTTTTTTTTTRRPPAGGYLPPIRADGNNPHFVSVDFPQEPPAIERSRPSPTPAIAPTPQGFSPPPPPRMMDKGQMPYMPYDINWGVQDQESGNMFSHSERSEGSDVHGEYRVMLPDGRMQVVSFWADPTSGYNADVKYL